MRQWSIDAPGLVPWRTGAAEALLRQGERDQALALLDDQLERLGDDFDSIRGRALRLRARCAPQDQPIALLTEAARIAENGADRFELALVLADLSHASAAVGEHRAARLVARRHELPRRTADGHSNRAIAAKMFITESTVEQHRADLLVSLAQM